MTRRELFTLPGVAMLPAPPRRYEAKRVLVMVDPAQVDNALIGEMVNGLGKVGLDGVVVCVQPLDPSTPGIRVLDLDGLSKPDADIWVEIHQQLISMNTSVRPRVR